MMLLYINEFSVQGNVLESVVRLDPDRGVLRLLAHSHSCVWLSLILCQTWLTPGNTRRAGSNYLSPFGARLSYGGLIGCISGLWSTNEAPMVIWLVSMLCVVCFWSGRRRRRQTVNASVPTRCANWRRKNRQTTTTTCEKLHFERRCLLQKMTSGVGLWVVKGGYKWEVWGRWRTTAARYKIHAAQQKETGAPFPCDSLLSTVEQLLAELERSRLAARLVYGSHED